MYCCIIPNIVLLYYFKYCIVVLIKLKKMVVEIKQPKINKYKVTYPQNKGHLSMCPQMVGRLDHPVAHAQLFHPLYKGQCA